jgi:hypothetical protein
MSYLTLRTGTIRRLLDNAQIPLDNRNADYQEYLLWKATNGDAPLEPIPPDTAPSYRRFYRQVYKTAVFQNLLTTAASSLPLNIAITAFNSEILAAIAGDVDEADFQVALNRLVTAASLTAGQKTGLRTLLTNSNLTYTVT